MFVIWLIWIAWWLAFCNARPLDGNKPLAMTNKVSRYNVTRCRRLNRSAQASGATERGPMGKIKDFSCLTSCRNTVARSNALVEMRHSTQTLNLSRHTHHMTRAISARKRRNRFSWIVGFRGISKMSIFRMLTIICQMAGRFASACVCVCVALQKS